MEKLLEKALDMRQFSHAPHSNFRVGAALLTADGTIFGGCNIESDVYGLTMCAERNAIFTAFSQGHRNFKAIAVITSSKGTPCGACRQIIAELCGNITIITADLNRNQSIYTAYELLPHHFTLNTSLNILGAKKIHEASI
ncbi:cytidine deaminase [Candidatus Babeliales bacterium]|nr:cytidine deaminase [Candidatus Babeliales bacterium]MBP9844235.1 cytidine deaminase [Candidatus Babeliales bacterium]